MYVGLLSSSWYKYEPKSYTHYGASNFLAPLEMSSPIILISFNQGNHNQLSSTQDSQDPLQIGRKAASNASTYHSNPNNTLCTSAKRLRKQKTHIVLKFLNTLCTSAKMLRKLKTHIVLSNFFPFERQYKSLCTCTLSIS